MYNSIKWYMVISIFVDLTVEPCTVLLFQIKLAAEKTMDVELLSPWCMPVPSAFTVHPSLRSSTISSSTLESYSLSEAKPSFSEVYSVSRPEAAE